MIIKQQEKMSDIPTEEKRAETNCLKKRKK